MRLSPKPGVAFPWARAHALLRARRGMHLEPLDVDALVAAGAKMGWSRVVLERHRRRDRGRCFRFDEDEAPHLSGTLYDDGIAFSFDDDDHAAACRPAIEALARSLDLDVA